MTLATAQYVSAGKRVTDHLGPINATMFIATGVLVPVMDFIRPHFPYMGYVAGAIVLFFALLLVMKWAKVPANRVIPTSLILSVGVCAAAFSVGAVASSRHAAQGGFMAASSDDARALQSNLLRLEQQAGDMQTTLRRMESGKSDDPRVELRNIGVEWSEDGLRNSSRIGDLRALELFLRGGMNIYSSYDSNRISLAASIIANNSPRMKEQLQLLAQYGYGLNDASTVQAKQDPLAPPNLYVFAKKVRNEEAAKLLVAMGVDTTSYESWKARQPKPVVLPGAL
jgi:hypothetical protein